MLVVALYHYLLYLWSVLLDEVLGYEFSEKLPASDWPGSVCFPGFSR